MKWLLMVDLLDDYEVWDQFGHTLNSAIGESKANKRVWLCFKQTCSA